MDRRLAEVVWALMESSRFRLVSLDDIELNGFAAELAVPYLETLIKHDYVTMCVRTAPATGEFAMRFMLKNLTGPMAPYVADNGSFIDPNLQRNGNQTGAAGRGAKPKDKTEPTPSARIVAMARQLKKFTRAEILEATGLAGQNDHSSAYLRGLSNRGWLYRLDRNEWQLAGTPQAAEIVENVLKKAAGGDPVDMIQAHRKWGAEIPQRTVGFVVHVMQAEGWKIETYPPSGKIGRTTYQVEAR
jgi:hypothetical protein